MDCIVLAGERDPGLTGANGDKLSMLAAESDVAELTAAAVNGPDGVRATADSAELRDVWFTDREKTLPRWPYIEDWLVTELD
jgi:hypothetical protein